MDCPAYLSSAIAVGRAAAGIYLILKHHGLAGKEILVPANLCYAAIYPAVYAGMCPRFCDVDPVTGNVTEETFRAACGPDTAAAIVPHMYGNPVADFKEIAGLCRDRNILLIEDCASAMGAESDRYALGRTGDYGVFSTGYSKTLDLGGGGFVSSSRHDLEPLRRMEQTLPPESPENERDQAFFSRLYRCLRNEGKGSALEKHIMACLPQWEKDWYLFSLPETEKTALREKLRGLAPVIRERRQALAYYADRLRDTDLTFYPYEKNSVPWRFNLLAEPEKRRRIIDLCLSRGLPVSDWYPRVTPLFGDAGDYPGALWHETHILNFPLLISDEQKDAICESIRECR